jgi:tetrahydromethanopterin S-methyltransferase subunit B
MVVAIMVLGITRGSCQTPIPEILDKGTLSEQMKYVQERTLIYENYRAIREDMFQKIKNNSIDSLTKAKNQITGFMELTSNLNVRIDSLNNSLNATKEELKELSRTKNSISVLGIKLDKAAYNTIMWTIVAGLVALLVIGYLSFKVNRSITLNTKKELKELREEFEEYRKKSRLEREKMSMDHFNAIKKLRGG